MRPIVCFLAGAVFACSGPPADSPIPAAPPEPTSVPEPVPVPPVEHPTPGQNAYLFAPHSLRPMAGIYTTTPPAPDAGPLTVTPRALVRFERDPDRWAPVELTARSIQLRIGETTDVSEWLAVELEAHNTYALLFELDGEEGEMTIVVSEILCEDRMLTPPAPPGTHASCVAAPGGGAEARYIPPPGPALHALVATR